MKSSLNLIGLFLLAGMLFSSCNKKQKAIVYDNKVIAPVMDEKVEEEKIVEEAPLATEIKWVTWEEAVALNKKDGKKVFIDMYTDWCGWCKRMDASTFKDQTIINALTKDFHAVKFNAEQKDPIEFRGTKFEFTKAGLRGAHGLAVALLDGKLGYPSFVYLDEKMDRITISPGYKKPDGLMQELNWVSGEVYKTQSFNDFKKM